MYNHRLSPQQGWTNACEQDFCQGAKVSKSQQHGFSTYRSPLYDQHQDEWMEIQDILGYDELDTFSDVILPPQEPKDLYENFEPNEFSAQLHLPDEIPIKTDPIVQLDAFSNVILPQEPKFGPEDLFEDFEPNGFSAQLHFRDEIAIKPNPIGQEHVKPAFTIKLIKVKCPTQPKPVPFSPPPPSSPCFEIASPGSQTEPTEHVVTEIFENSFTLPSVSASNLYTEFNNSSRSMPSPPSITLKDAFELENPDLILDSYLSSDGCASPDPVINYTNTSNSQDSFQVPNMSWNSTGSLFSNESSPVSSPCYSEDHLSSVALPPEDSQRSAPGKVTVKNRKATFKLSPQSRYIRKKEQNKQAAIRYRAKKKQEDEQLMIAMTEDEARREDLEKTLKNLMQEAKIMKKLMRETFIARNRVSPTAFD